MSNDGVREKDYEAYRSLLNLWAKENPIKTNKLQILLMINGLLVSAVQINGGFKIDNWAIYLAGLILSLIWVFSIGRTCLFQNLWQQKIKRLANKYPQDERFKLLDTSKEEREAPFALKLAGSLSSKYYLIGAPILFSICWFVAIIYTVLFKA